MKLLNEKQVAEMLGVTPIALRKLRCMGATPSGMPELPFLKLGFRVRYVESDVLQYIENLRVTSAGGAA